MDKEEIRPITKVNAEKIMYWSNHWGARFKTERSLNDCRVLHHLERYWFVSAYWRKHIKHTVTILDAGCGECIGAQELLRGIDKTDYIIGVEIDQEVVDAITTPFTKRDSYQDNVETMSLEERFDIVTCYELLGNESMKSDRAMILNLYNHLPIHGMLFLSIPNYKHGDTPKDYFNRVYTEETFNDTIHKALHGEVFAIEFFHQLHPVNRETNAQLGVQEGRSISADFCIAVIRRQR